MVVIDLWSWQTKANLILLGVHCDSKGNVYAGCGDGVNVWNRSGKLIGKIYLGMTSANFQFAGDGRMVICAETDLFYVTLAASGAPIQQKEKPMKLSMIYEVYLSVV